MRPDRRLCARTGRANRAAGLAPGGLDRDWRQQNLSGTFYYLCSILDGIRRSIDHYEIREPMTEQAVGELGLRRAQPSRRADVEIIPATARRAGCGHWKPFPRPGRASSGTTARPGSLTAARIACTVPSALLLRRINWLAGRRRFWKIVKESWVKFARNEPKIGGYNRPWLMSSVGRRTEHAGQTTITLTSMHAHFEKVRAVLIRVSALLQEWVSHATEQLRSVTVWQLVCDHLKLTLSAIDPPKIPPLIENNTNGIG